MNLRFIFVGNLAVFKGGTAGHVAICLGGGDTKKFMRFEQNKPLGTNAHIQEGSYYNMLGVLRPKNVIISDIPEWFTTLAQKKGLSLEREGEFEAPLDIVIAGGTSMPKGFRDKVKSVVDELDLPFEIKDVIQSEDPRNAVVKGLLTQAIISQKKLKDKKIDEMLE